MRTSRVIGVAALIVVAVPAAVVAVDAAMPWRPRATAHPPALPDSLPALDAAIDAAEARVPGVLLRLRKGFRWHANQVRRTPIALVYLHGFSATRREISPVVERASDSLGANVFFSRLAAHGAEDGEAFATVTAQDWLDDAREALAIGRKIGERVVIVGTSTGANLALLLAAESRDSLAPAALVLISPNYAPADWRAPLASGPFGGLVARTVIGPYREFVPLNDKHAALWTTRYRSEGIAAMEDLVRAGGRVDVGALRLPVLTLWTHADDVVRTDLIVARQRAFGSAVKPIVDVPGAVNHVLAGNALGPASTDTTVALIVDFVRRHVAPH